MLSVVFLDQLCLPAGQEEGGLVSLMPKEQNGKLTLRVLKYHAALFSMSAELALVYGSESW